MNHILTHHQGGMFPPRGWFNKPGLLRFGFLGRPTDGDCPNPGSPRKGSDPAWNHKLARLFGQDCRIRYIPGRHDGGIVTVDGTELQSELFWQTPDKTPLVTAFYGDAIVIDYQNIPDKMLPFAAVIKVCDCGNWVFENPSTEQVSLVHVSVASSVQYNRPNKESLNTRGPILDRVMERIGGGNGKIHVAFGSSINGLQDQDHHCYPWDEADAERLSICIRTAYPNLLQTDLFRDHPTAGKVDFNFGLFQYRLAQQIGLAEADGLDENQHWGPDVSHNACTCRPELYSMRIAQNAKDDPFISNHDKGILSAEARHRYGNLAFVYIKKRT